MPVDEHSPEADDPRRESGAADTDARHTGAADRSDAANSNARGGADDFNAQLLARLAQLERAFGEQSARIGAIERRLGLVKYKPKPQASEPGDPSVSDAATAHVEAEGRDPWQQRPVTDAPDKESADAARESTSTPFGTPRPGVWQQESGASAQGADARAHAAGDAGARDANLGGRAGAAGANAGGAGAATADETADSSILPTRRDFEQLIGGGLFKWVGVVFVALAVGFFLKIALDREWIGERGQVLLGALAGVGLLALAERLRARGYRSYAYVLSGGGVLILYLTVYAARVFYELIEVIPAFVLMVAVTTTAVLLAARYNAYAIAVLGLIGGFMTPALLSTGVDNQIGLFGYVALLNAGVLALAYFRRWRSLNHLAFYATVLTFAGWYVAHYEEWKLWRTLFFLTLFFLMFNALGVVYNVIRQRPARWFDISLIISNATLFFAASYGLLEENHHTILGSYALLWSGFYVLLFYFTYQRHRADKLLALSYVGAAVTFFTLAAAIQLDQHWVTIVWAMEALMLTWIGLRADTDAPRRVALPVFAFTLLHWFMVDMNEFPHAAGSALIPLLNRRTFSAATIVAALAGAVWLYRRAGEKVEREEREIISTVFILAANVLALTLLTLEINDYFKARAGVLGVDPASYEWQGGLENSRQFSLTVLWAFYALAALVVGVKRNLSVLRYAALAWLAVTGVKIIALDAGFYNAAWHLPLANQTFAAFAAYVAALWYAARLYVHSGRIDEAERGIILATITVAANIYALTALSLEATGYFEKLIRAGALAGEDTGDLRLAQGLSLSLVWTLYGGAMLLYGHRRANRLLRLMALLLLTATAFKVFFLDLAVLEKFYRIVSFLVLGAILLAVSFLYQQKQSAAKSEDDG
ncbi:MAG TPA: DUF2339 domain-containing protein [Pyrinomonadaceae bacterium]|nr:DUF2339 domain-containing protein [Pyrinomonadaceae bacterium]